MRKCFVLLVVLIVWTVLHLAVFALKGIALCLSMMLAMGERIEEIKPHPAVNPKASKEE